MVFLRVTTRQTLATLLLALWLCLTGVGQGVAQPATEKILPMDGKITADGQAVELSWFDAKPPRVGSVTVKRRLYGQVGGQSWKTLASGLGPVLRYTDETITPGTAYEYQVLRNGKDIVDVGYWLTGHALPAQARRGNAYVIVDETVVGAISSRLDRFGQDLSGDGWQVQRAQVPRHNREDAVANVKNALLVKNWLQARYRADPFGRHVVILVGHVPMVRSGKVNPDGHNRVSHGTDLFYADIDGRWRLMVNGSLLDNHVPGNSIEMQVGRIDFATQRAGQDQNGNENEISLLRAYFDKNHHWRHGRLGDVRGAYGGNQNLLVEWAGLRNIVGPAQVVPGGHHDVGEERPWLWGVDFGDRKGAIYARKYANKAVFAINFGSGKQQIQARDNAMAALLSQPWYTVAVGWGARPAWWLHHMALGGSIGDVHMRTVNNGELGKPYRESMDYFPTGKYLMRNAIWVNLLGDPTLRGFPLAAPRAVTLQQGGQLSWTASPDPDVIGYRVFRADADSDRFEALTGAELVQGLEFTDPKPRDGTRYMVRAYGLKQVHAGSFYTLSQGVEAISGAQAPVVPTFHLTTAPDQSVALPEDFNTVQDGVIHAVIEGPTQGRVTQGETGWLYTPPSGFAGEVSLRVSRSNSGQTTEGTLTITVE